MCNPVGVGMNMNFSEPRVAPRGMRRFGLPWALEWNAFGVGNAAVIFESSLSTEQFKQLAWRSSAAEQFPVVAGVALDAQHRPVANV